NPNAMVNAYYGGDEMFWPRPCKSADEGCGPTGHDLEDNVMYASEQKAFEAIGGHFVKAEQAMQLPGMPGVWLTGRIGVPGNLPGEVIRNHDEKTYPGEPYIQPPGGATP